MELSVERAKEMIRENPEVVVFFVIFALCIALVLWAVKADSTALAEWQQHCVQDLGGHVVSKDATTVGISTKDGSTVITPKTDYYCLSDSGGILDLR